MSNKAESIEFHLNEALDALRLAESFVMSDYTCMLSGEIDVAINHLTTVKEELENVLRAHS